jgi:redox-sensitive bicupin YhaK (pirin superfamily)
MEDIFHDRQSRGTTRSGLITSHHTFSFGNFRDPNRMGFRALRVINEDYLLAGAGFAEHAHDHFEILTVVLLGTVSHRDSAGHEGFVSAMGIQLISSGSGIRHSEFNPSPDEPTHLFQIWLHGEADTQAPRYQQREHALPAQMSEKRLIASPTGEAESLALRAPVCLFAGLLASGDSCALQRQPSRFAWLQVLDGVIALQSDGESAALELRGGDALQLAQTRDLQLTAQTDARYLWFDLA